MRPEVLALTLFAVVFAYNFREAVKTAQAWGAFRLDLPWTRSGRLKLVFSLVTLAILPLLAFALLWSTVRVLPTQAACPAVLSVALRRLHLQQLEIPCALSAALLSVLLLGFLPRGAKHLWLPIARRRGWVQTASTLRPTLYSLQVILLCLLLPIIVVVCYGKTGLFWQLDRDFWSRLLLIAYGAEMITLFQIARAHGQFETKERWLLSLRWLLSFFYTILLPLAFGLFAFILTSGARAGGHPGSLWVFPEHPTFGGSAVSFVVLLMFLAVPYGFNQTYLLKAAPWSDAEQIRKGNRQWWKASSVFIVVPIVASVCIWRLL